METTDFYYIHVTEAARSFSRAASRQSLGLTKSGHVCNVASNDLATFDSYQDAEAFLKHVKKHKSSGNTRHPIAGKRHYQVRYRITPEDRLAMANAACSKQTCLVKTY